jgi:protocatechuate 3,4-dioxygenase beta subunit
MTDGKRINRRHVLGAGMALPLAALAPRATGAETCGVTPRQTSGPFYPVFEQVDKDVDLTRLTGHDRAARGEQVRVQGRVLDAACQPVAGALVDLWQADSFGRYMHPADPNPARPDANFQGWGQAVTDANGRYSFRTIKPASYPMEFLGDKPDPAAGYRTPHIHFRVSKRGYVELSTQMYFAGEKLNDADIVLAKVPAADRDKVVIAAGKSAADELPLFVFDITIARA